jgi:ParB-like chromosome segregation protein Spo0J
MIDLNTIKENPTNPRYIDKHKFEQLKGSIREFPEMMKLRPIVIDNEGVVLGGNMRLKALRDMAYEEVPDEWIVKADDLTPDQKKEFIIKDNVGFGAWDWDILANEWDVQDLIDWGLDVPEISDPYTAKIEAPNYEPSSEKPDLADLVDRTKYAELIEEIEAAKIPEDVKDFLAAAATRHFVFNYSWIADYYAHSKPEIQDLFERSALVIIDFDKAIKNGFVELSSRLNKIFDDDEG